MRMLLGLLILLTLGGCGEPHSKERADDEPTAFKPTTVVLSTAEAAQKLEGIATLVSAEGLAQINADMRAAEIAANFSSRTLARYKVIKTLPEHSVDNAERQAATDTTQLALLRLKLRNSWGDQAPFLAANARQQIVDELSSGRTALVRLDFPRAVDRELKHVRVQPLGGGNETPIQSIWVAPSGSLAMPGTSFYGLMPAGPGLRPGDRARVLAEGSTSSVGVIVPASAVVVYEGGSWCYVETRPETYERKAVALSMPVDEGYLVTDLAPGTKVVSRGAAVLLSREAEPVLDDDDDGAPVAKSERKETPVASTSADPD